jgi:hypothetical protein
VKLFSTGFIENTYFWFVIPAILVSYVVTIFLTIKEENATIAIISSALFFASLKFVFSLIWTDDISKPWISYFYERSVNSVSSFGYFDFKEIGEIFLSFAEHPPVIITMSMIKTVTGLEFVPIFSFLMLPITPLIIMPIVYRFFRRILGLERNQAILGLMLYNSNFLNFGYDAFGYGTYGFLLFTLSLFFLGEKNRLSRGVFFLLCFVNSMTYSISSFSLIFFVVILYLMQRLNFLNKTMKLSSSDVLFPIITTLLWSISRATSDITTVKTIAELFLGHLTLVPELIHPAISYVISDPYAYLIYFMYIGQGLFLLLGFVGLIIVLRCFRNKKNLMYVLLWLLAGFILAFFAFGVRWLNIPLIIGDYRFRFVKSFWLLIVPLTAFGFQRVESTLSRISGKKVSFIAIGVLALLIIFSPIANNASTVLQREPISANDTTIAPHQWIQLSHFVSSYAPKNTIFLGCERSRLLWSTGAIPANRLLVESNPYTIISEFKGPYFLAFMRHNLYLPDEAWPSEPILTNKQFESINLRCSKYFDSGDVWLYYYKSAN